MLVRRVQRDKLSNPAQVNLGFHFRVSADKLNTPHNNATENQIK